MIADFPQRKRNCSALPFRYEILSFPAFSTFMGVNVFGFLAQSDAASCTRQLFVEMLFCKYLASRRRTSESGMFFGIYDPKFTMGLLDMA